MKKYKTLLIGLVLVALTGCQSPTATRTLVIKQKMDLSTIEKTTIEKHYYDLPGRASMPAAGNLKFAVIPIWFADSSTEQFYVGTSGYLEPMSPMNRYEFRHNIDKAFFGTPEEVGWNSVKSFYETESGGTLTISGKTSYWYECPLPSTEYYDRQADRSKQIQLMKDAVEFFFETNPDEARTDYDSDQDGYLDYCCFIYAAPNYNFSQKEDAKNMWAYRSSVQNSSLCNVTKPGLNNYFWASCDFVWYNYGPYHTLSTEVLIHETGHGFGIMDYYDYNYLYSPAGCFTMQDYNVCGHDPFSVMSIGWCDPYIPTETTRIQIGAFQKNHDLILLTPEWNSLNSAFDEYLLLELYTSTGLNEFHDENGRWIARNMQDRHFVDSEVGIRLWHVDARLTYQYDDWQTHMMRWSKDLTNDPSAYNATEAMSNTYYVEDGAENDRCSRLGSDYYNYNLLELIQCSAWMSAPQSRGDTTLYLYREGTGFTLGENQNITIDDVRYDVYRPTSYFKNNGKLNSGLDLGWSFVVESIEGTGDDAVATIVLIKD